MLPEIREDDIYSSIRNDIITAQNTLRSAVNFAMVQTYWKIGKQIVEVCQDKRAEYGKKLVKDLSDRLVVEFGKSYSVRNLHYMRQFYMVFPIVNTLCSQLSWSHYRLLMKVNDTSARDFYMNECAEAGWSVRELERQITTFAYQRVIANQDNAVKLKTTNEPYDNFVKDPYVLEFLDLKAPPEFYEKDLEAGILQHLQEFLLELGRGFSFVARQKHLSIDGDDFYIDLVFYNYILKCFVLIDLKLGKLKHQDIGQMQMYVNYYEQEMMNEGDNKPIGIVLCAEKNDAVVKFTLGNDTNIQIYAAKYMPYMPTEEELKRELQLDKLPALLKAREDD